MIRCEIPCWIQDYNLVSYCLSMSKEEIDCIKIYMRMDMYDCEKKKIQLT